MAGLDFDSIITKHKDWKTRLRSMLDGKGGLSINDAVSHKDCDFGKWLYSEGKTKYGSLNELDILEKSHTQMHAKVREVIEKKMPVTQSPQSRVIPKWCASPTL